MMKHFYLMLTAMFCALPLISRAAPQTRVPAYNWENTDTVKYFVAAASYSDEYGSFDPMASFVKMYEMGVVRNGNSVTFTNLFDIYDPDSWSPIFETPIVGTYDAAQGTVTFDVNVPYCNVYDAYTGNLVAFSSLDEYGGVPVGGSVDKLVFDVTPDFKTITSRSGFGVEYDYGFVARLKQLKATREDPTDPAILSSATDAIDFGNTYAGLTLDTSFTVINTGGQAGEYVLTIEGDAFAAESISGSVQPYSQSAIALSFQPSSVGTFTGKLTLEAEGQQPIEISLKGEGLATPDYSSIVSGGAFTFETSVAYPALVQEMDHPLYNADGTPQLNPDGTPKTEKVTAAFMTTGGTYDQSFLKVKFTVPQDKVGKLTLKGHVANPTGASYKMNCYIVEDSDVGIAPDYMETSDFKPEHTSWEFNPGDHYLYFLMLDGYSNTDGVGMYIWDLDLQMEDPEGYGPVVKTPEVFLGYGAADQSHTVERQGTIVVRNQGTEPMSIVKITCDNPEFDFSQPTTVAGLLEDITIPVELMTTTGGDKVANFTIETNLGTVTAKAFATVCDYPDYSTLFTEGADLVSEFVVNPDFPFGIKDGVAYNLTSKHPDTVANTSTMTFYVEVPENHVVDFSFEVHSWGTPADMYTQTTLWDFGGYIIDRTGSITNDGLQSGFYDNDKTYDETMFDGTEDEDLSMYFRLYEGHNEIEFFYTQAGDNHYYGEDRLDIHSIGLKLVPLAGIDTVETLHSVKTEYYDINGRRHDTPVTGINLVRRTMSDGSVRVEKMVR